MALPGLDFRPRGRNAAASPIHSDVAGFVGRTRRGPVGQAIRVEGWRRFVRLFGDLDSNLTLTFALRGYFENGGQVAYVVRVAGEMQERASLTWTVPRTEMRYRICASSPGIWGKDVRVSWDWRHKLGRLVVSHPHERTEYHVNLDTSVTQKNENDGLGITLAEQIRIDSDLIELQRLLPDGIRDDSAQRDGQLNLPWSFDEAAEQPTLAEYVAAVQTLGDEPEVALLAVPGMFEDLMPTEHDDLREALLKQAIELQDRLVILDPPMLDAQNDRSVQQVAKFVNGLRKDSKWEGIRRGGAIYGPWLRVPNPLGGLAEPLKTMPASGHVAGVVSRLDRERGPHHTPANVSLLDAVDVEQRLKPDDQNALNDAGLNLIRCQPGRGLMVWGGRTLDPEEGARFVAHRRLIHRLVRAIRRVAEPLVFDGNTPAMWLAFTRAITTVLLESFRAGALKGERPEEGFKVECNEKTNPVADQELGRVTCLISLAPAIPMEFITLRVALSEDKQVEVFDA